MSITRSTHLFCSKVGNPLEVCIMGTIRLEESPFEIGDKSLILRSMYLAITMLSYVSHLKIPRNTIEDFFSFFFGEFFPWSIYIDCFNLTDSIKKKRIIWMVLPWEECTFCERKIRACDISFEECRRRAKPMTGLTGAMVRVKRKM